MDPLSKYRLPLFPLPAVLFPTATMPLHIFESRYQRMVTRCLETDRRFGLIHHDADASGPFLTEEGQVGCLAEIEDFQPLPDDRAFMVVRGVERFRMVDGIESEEPFYEGLVAPYQDIPSDDIAIDLQRRRTLALFRSVLQILPQDPGAVPEFDPSVEVSFPLVRTIGMDPPWQQAFLEVRREAHRLERLDAVFRAALG